MNTQTEEALKMAIEAMERAEEIDWELNSLHVLNILQAIQACKEALAQPAQEPVKQKVKVLYEKDGIQTCEILPTPSWQGLSDDELLELLASKGETSIKYLDFARAIEQALKEKNHGD